MFPVTQPDPPVDDVAIEDTVVPARLDRGSTAEASRASGTAAIRRAIGGAEFGLVLAIVATSALLTVIEPNFLSVGTAQSVLRASAYVGIIAVAQCLLLITREFDLSVGAVAGLGAVVASKLMEGDTGVAWPLAVAAGIAAGAVAGLANGLLITQLRIPALVVTLGMLYIAQGLSLVVTGGFPISDLPSDFLSIGQANPLGLPWAAWIFFGAVVVGSAVLRTTTFGRRIYATGGNARAANYGGLRPARTKIVLFVTVSSLAALAGILLIARVRVADPTIGQGWELQSIGGAVVGGVSLFGGVGTVVGAFLGIVFLQLVTTGLVIAGFDTSLQSVAVGVLLIGAIAVDRWRQRRFGTGA